MTFEFSLENNDWLPGAQKKKPFFVVRNQAYENVKRLVVSCIPLNFSRFLNMRNLSMTWEIVQRKRRGVLDSFDLSTHKNTVELVLLFFREEEISQELRMDNYRNLRLRNWRGKLEFVYKTLDLSKLLLNLHSISYEIYIIHKFRTLT